MEINLKIATADLTPEVSALVTQLIAALTPGAKAFTMEQEPTTTATIVPLPPVSDAEAAQQRLAEAYQAGKKKTEQAETVPPAEKKLTAKEKKALAQQKAAEEAAAKGGSDSIAPELSKMFVDENGFDDLTGEPLTPTKEVTVEDLVSATQNAVFRNAGNRDKIRAYLDEAGIDKVTNLPKANWPTFIAYAETL